MTPPADFSVEDLTRLIDLQRVIATSALDLENLMRLICARARELIPVSGAVVELIDGSEMVYRAVDGLPLEHLGLRLSVNASLSGISVLQNQVLLCEDTETDPRVDRPAARRLGLRSMICVPLVTRGTPVGVLKLFDRRPNAFTARDVTLLGLAAGVLSAVLRQASEAAAKDEARAALSESERALRTLVDTAYEAVTISKNGVIARCNPRFLEMFDLTEAEVLGRSLVDFVAPFERARVRHNHATRYADFYEFMALRRDGSVFPCEGRGRTVEVNGEMIRVSTLRDVSERRLTEQAAREAETRARAVARRTTQVLAEVAAELASPVRDVDRLIRRLEDGLDPRAAAADLAVVGVTLSRLADDVGQLARLETPGGAPVTEPFDLDELVAGVLRAAAPLARRRGVPLNAHAEVRLPPLVGDAARVRQIVNGLVTAALNDAADAGVHVLTRLLTRNDVGYLIRLEVRGGRAARGARALDLSLSERLAQALGADLSFGDPSSLTLSLPTRDVQEGLGTRLNDESSEGGWG